MDKENIKNEYIKAQQFFAENTILAKKEGNEANIETK